MAVSGTAVGLATAGGVLLYAGLSGQSPLSALRSVASGKPQPLSRESPVTAAALAGTGAVAATGLETVEQSGGLTALVGAVEQYSADLYSQTRRWQKGYSDCSSFVGKGLLAIGITPPGASVTGSYLAWAACVKISPTEVGAGDLICNSDHIIVATSNTTGIGQENPSVNVQQGSIADLMYGTGAYVCLRYVPPADPEAEQHRNA